MTTSGFGSRPSATSSTCGASSRQNGRGTSGSSGWSNVSAGGSGWGSGANNDKSASDGWSNEPSAWGEQASSSQWGMQTEGWGSSGWETTGTDVEPGWGGDSIPSHTNGTHSTTIVAKVSGLVGPDIPIGGTRTDCNADVTTTSSRTMPSILSTIEPGAMHSEQGGDNTAPALVGLSPLESKASPSATPLRQSSTNESIKMRPMRSDHSKPSDANKTRFVRLPLNA